MNDLKGFRIGWFATILGSGGVALASLQYFPILSILLAYILTAIFVVLSVLWLIKIVLYPGVVKEEIRHFVIGNYYPLQPISAVILSLLYYRLSIPFERPLLVYGAIMIFIFTIYILYNFFATTTAKLNHIHGGWFIPPVSTILVTYAMLLEYPPSLLTLTISLVFFGIGLMLFLFIATILFLRLVSHELPAAELAPTNFILLAPVGILILDFMKIASFASKLLPNAEALPAIFFIISLSLWGFGVWALIVNIMILLKYLKQEYPFFFGWWSYVFPIAAFTIGTAALSTQVDALSYISGILYGFLLVIWAVVSLNTLKILLK
ncbi:tellurite-resistance/dicarboxylate transporter [Geoglobus sp.]